MEVFLASSGIFCAKTFGFEFLKPHPFGRSASLLKDAKRGMMLHSPLLHFSEPSEGLNSQPIVSKFQKPLSGAISLNLRFKKMTKKNHPPK